jgi:uncharacterized membrane protein
VRRTWAVVGLLTAIGVAVAVRRLVSLSGPVSDPAAVDAGFARHGALTAAHVVPGLLFLLLGPVQLATSIRRRFPALHRWLGRVFLAAGLVVGATALAMGPRMAIGGALETAATTVFGVWFLIALGTAFVAIRRRQIARHRQWMIRAYATGLAVTTIRPIIGMFFATSRLTGLTPRDFFGMAFWIGFTAHVLTAEIWIRNQRVPRPPSI